MCLVHLQRLIPTTEMAALSTANVRKRSNYDCYKSPACDCCTRARMQFRTLLIYIVKLYSKLKSLLLVFMVEHG